MRSAVPRSRRAHHDVGREPLPVGRAHAGDPPTFESTRPPRAPQEPTASLGRAPCASFRGAGRLRETVPRDVEPADEALRVDQRVQGHTLVDIDDAGLDAPALGPSALAPQILETLVRRGHLERADDIEAGSIVVLQLGHEVDGLDREPRHHAAHARAGDQPRRVERRPPAVEQRAPIEHRDVAPASGRELLGHRSADDTRPRPRPEGTRHAGMLPSPDASSCSSVRHGGSTVVRLSLAAPGVASARKYGLGDSVMQGPRVSCVASLHGEHHDEPAVLRCPGDHPAAREEGPPPRKVAIHLGNNGYIDPAGLSPCGENAGNRQVFLVTVKVPRSWRRTNKQRLRTCARRHGADIIDWYSFSRSHDSWFYSDGFHLTPSASASMRGSSAARREIDRQAEVGLRIPSAGRGLLARTCR